MIIAVKSHLIPTADLFLHSGGLTFSNDSFSDSDTLVVVQAPGAKGARINYGNSTIDRWGYGVTNALSLIMKTELHSILTVWKMTLN